MTYANYADKPPVHFSVTNLAKPHFDHLIAEGFTDADIAIIESEGVRSIEYDEARDLAFSVREGGGLIFPAGPGCYQLRADNPPLNEKGKPCKYISPVGGDVKAFYPKGSPSEAVTEGFKDAMMGTLRGGVPTAAVTGVNLIKKALPKGCGLTILFDSDGWHNPNVFGALVTGAIWCDGKIQLVPEIEKQPKAGLCEYFKAGHTANDYRKLIDSAMFPREFLIELPKHWVSLSPERLGECLRKLFRIASELPDAPDLDELLAVCRANLPGIDIEKYLDVKMSKLVRKLFFWKEAKKDGGAPTATLNQPSQHAKAFIQYWGDTMRYSTLTESYWSYSDGMFRELSEVAFNKQIQEKLDLTPVIGYGPASVESVGKMCKAYIVSEHWRQPKHLLPFKNGVLNIETKELSPHSPDFGFTWQLPYGYDPLAICKPIEDWLTEVQSGDISRVQFLRAYLRAILIGDSGLQRFLEIIGPGGTGKGTYSRLAMGLVGIGNTHSTTLKALEYDRFEPANLYGKRLVVISDSERYGGEVSMLKAITGGDPIRYEQKYKNCQVPYVFGGMLILAANDPIQSSDYTSGLGRRRAGCSFTQTFEPQCKRTLMEIEDGEFVGEFVPYMPGLVNWVLAMPYNEMKAYVVDTANAVPSLNDDRLESIMATNPIAAWFDECCYLNPGVRVQVGEKKVDEDRKGEYLNQDIWLYPSYVAYCESHGHRSMALNRFGDNLIDLLKNQLHIDGIEKPKRDRNGSHFIGFSLRGLLDRPRPLTAPEWVWKPTHLTAGGEEVMIEPESGGSLEVKLSDRRGDIVDSQIELMSETPEQVWESVPTDEQTAVKAIVEIAWDITKFADNDVADLARSWMTNHSRSVRSHSVRYLQSHPEKGSAIIERIAKFAPEFANVA